MFIKFITDAIRYSLVGFENDFKFRKINPRKFKIPKIKESSLYIHIPFCKSMCFYCPYNKVKYSPKLIAPYVQSLLKEIGLYAQKLGKIKISSIYIGGGTPTNITDELGVVLEKIKKEFNVNGDIAVETTVADINEYTVKKLKSYDVNLISLGVQSFSDKYLKMLGRNYNSEEIIPAIQMLQSIGFDTINIDLMFCLPFQTEEEIVDELKKAIKLGVDQITLYPLFTFPYSSIGEYKKIKNIKMPNIFIRRKFYRLIHEFLLKNGFNRVSVWGFQKTKKQKYSSVTRRHYIGLGAGAGSSFLNKFYFNTFSIDAYNKRLSKNFLPIAVSMNVSKMLSDYYWLYWKFYETSFRKKELKQSFGSYWKVIFLIKLLKLLNFCTFSKNEIKLTERGSFWIHLIQNYFVLNYIDKVWSIMKKKDFPDIIKI